MNTPTHHSFPSAFFVAPALIALLAAAGLTGCQSSSSLRQNQENRQTADLQLDRQIQELRQRAEKVEAAAARAGVDIAPLRQRMDKLTADCLRMRLEVTSHASEIRGLHQEIQTMDARITKLESTARQILVGMEQLGNARESRMLQAEKAEKSLEDALPNHENFTDLAESLCGPWDHRIFKWSSAERNNHIGSKMQEYLGYSPGSLKHNVDAIAFNAAQGMERVDAAVANDLALPLPRIACTQVPFMLDVWDVAELGSGCDDSGPLAGLLWVQRRRQVDALRTALNQEAAARHKVLREAFQTTLATALAQ